jgi:hypothetical protein
MRIDPDGVSKLNDDLAVFCFFEVSDGALVVFLLADVGIRGTNGDDAWGEAAAKSNDNLGRLRISGLP